MFNEWGTVFSSAEHYPGTKWEPKHPDDWYWTTDFVKNDTEIIRIDSGDGDLGTSPINGDKNRTACVTP